MAGWQLDNYTFDLHHSEYVEGNVMTEYEERIYSQGQSNLSSGGTQEIRKKKDRAQKTDLRRICETFRIFRKHIKFPSSQQARSHCLTQSAVHKMPKDGI